LGFHILESLRAYRLGSLIPELHLSLRRFSSESVTEGHPDKVADQISDAVLDHLLAQDPMSRVACETLVTTGLAMVAGEISSDARVEIPQLVRQTLLDIGYDDAAYGIDGATCAVLTSLDQQSGDIAMGVDSGGAGDQGMMFGYATDETDQLLPVPVVLAHRLTRGLARLRRSGQVPWLRPDGKAQVSVAYDGDRPVEITAVVVSAQHDPDVDQDTIREVLREQLILPQLPRELFDPGQVKIHVNPTGRFVTGGGGGAGRSSWTPMAGWVGTAEVPSPERTPPRWIGPQPTLPVGPPSTWWPPARPGAARSRSPTPSAWPNR